MTVLVVTNRRLTSSVNGYDLRVLHLCEALSHQEKLVQLVAPLDPADSSPPDIQAEALFAEIRVLPALGTFRLGPLRHIRLNQADFFKLACPDFLRAAVHEIEALCETYGIGKIVVFGSNLAGLVRGFAGRKKVLFDVCDSVVLTSEREIAAPPGPGRDGSLKHRVMLARWKALEGDLPRRFDQVTTINLADSATVAELAGGRHHIATVPNGVDPVLESAYREAPPVRKGVVFWGNLSYPPNRDAVRFFHDAVYVPRLKPAGIEWCIVGRNADDWLKEAAQADQGIRLTGYVADLRALVQDYPVMVNPMRIGSGLKNKVLESFAMGVAVVSSALGIESIAGAQAGRDYVLAESPGQFAQAVVALQSNSKERLAMVRSARRLVLERYTWEIVGRQWLDLFNEL